MTSTKPEEGGKVSMAGARRRTAGTCSGALSLSGCDLFRGCLVGLPLFGLNLPILLGSSFGNDQLVRTAPQHSLSLSSGMAVFG